MTYLPVLFGYHTNNIGNSHVPVSLCKYWNDGGRAVKLVVPSIEKNLSYPWLQPAMTRLKKILVYKLGIKDQPRLVTEKKFFESEKSAPVVFLWAGLSLDVFEQFHKNGTKIIIERINCHNATARSIIQNAEHKWGVKTDNVIRDDKIARENRKLALADAVFCPSPMVRQSMLDNGVPAEKLLSTSYGWEPERFPSISIPRKENLKPVFLFVGKLCLRKGLPLLLEAWRRAEIDGELLLCGAIDPDFQSALAVQLKQKNVRHLSFTNDIGEVYKQADIFVFPTLEEGGPMVTYEAMAFGIPPLVTAMGAGAIVQNGVNGVVLPDMDVDAWVVAMRDMAENRQKRLDLGASAKLRAQDFTWKNVAEQRAKLLEAKYPKLWGGCP